MITLLAGTEQVAKKMTQFAEPEGISVSDCEWNSNPDSGVAAVREFRSAIVSPSLGFTRVNYELGQVLLRMGRPAEAVAALQPALRGEIDAANLYVTRTELHELLAQAIERAGQPDSAAVHHRAVVRGWRRADPAFHECRARAALRLAALERR